jgi:hypothetical protein
MAVKISIMSMMFLLTFFLMSCHEEISVDYNNTYDPEADNYIPEKPSALTPGITADTGVSLSWIDRSAMEVGFVIERDVEFSGYYNVVDTVPANTTSYYHHFPLVNMLKYDYRIKAYNQNGARSYVYALYSATFALFPPYIASITSSRFDTIVIQWTYSSATGPTGYTVERSVNGLEFIPVAAVGKDVRAIHNGDVDTLNIYTYRIQALSRYNISGYSTQRNVKYDSQGWHIYY